MDFIISLASANAGLKCHRNNVVSFGRQGEKKIPTPSLKQQYYTTDYSDTSLPKKTQTVIQVNGDPTPY
jgi:hypothetical protein